MARNEQLRCEGIQRTMSRELAIFWAEGKCSGMHAWLFLPVKTSEGFERGGSSLNASKNEEMRFSGIWAEVVNILAAMSLEQLREDGI